ncbi:MAG TPA: hypothetical protein VNM14_08690 [Planctomycetota bacterium]|jgi:hypothetical protein|nr:hypothetical protein [Planctomycetota bacterium]
MKKFLLAGAAIAFAGIAATVAVAADHKAKPTNTHAAVMTAKTVSAHKDAAPKKHHVVKRHHSVHKSHAK